MENMLNGYYDEVSIFDGHQIASDFAEISQRSDYSSECRF